MFSGPNAKSPAFGTGDENRFHHKDTESTKIEF
jgi:hypothetical protein